MRNRHHRIEGLKIVLIYVVVSVMWIWLSDSVLLHLVDDSQYLSEIQTFKGIFFVLTSGFLLWGLVVRMQSRLRSYDQRYRATFHANPVPMWIHDRENLEILLVNDAAIRHYGYAEEEFVGMRLPDLHVERAVDPVTPAAVPDGSSGDSRLERHRCRDGTLIWVSCDTHPLTYQGKNAALSVCRDVTDSIRAREILTLHAEVFENSHQGIMITDDRNRLLAVNRAFEEITGYSRDEAKGRNPRFLQSGRQDPAFYGAMWRTVKEKGRWQGEIWNRRKSGEAYPEWLSLSTITDDDGHIQKHIGIFTDISADKDAQARIHFMAHYDPLTHLPNRNLLKERLHFGMLDASRGKSSLVLILMDLDHFKQINDALGRDAGDQLLLAVAERLGGLAGEGDTLSRQGSDEFVLLLPGQDSQDARQAVQQILGAFSEPFAIELADGCTEVLNLSVSAGVAVFPENAEDGEQLLQCADSALSRAKKAGRNTFHFFSEATQEQSLAYLKTKAGLHQALLLGEFRLHFQPQYDLKLRQLTGMEALIRWDHPTEGILSPDRFIPVAEESGLIVDIGYWAIDEAVSTLADWQARGLPLYPVAVNLSMVQFQRGELLEYIAGTLEAKGVPPHLLCLEITETVAMEDSDFTIAVVDKLHDLGTKVAIDDFGTGFSSLSYLRRLRIDKLKIDRSFVRGIGTSRSDEAIVLSVIALAETLGFETIAEGVETREQLDFLREAGCNEAQGYLFNRALPLARMENFLLRLKPEPAGMAS